jgi:chorismate lyase / 3-hydroxybenzoate synthase
MPPISAPNATLTVLYGAGEVCARADAAGLWVELPIPVLAGQQAETFALADVASFENAEGLSLCVMQDGVVAGVVTEPMEIATLEERTYAAFRRFLAAAGPVELYRVWNYVPQINHWEQGLENYHRFNRGRWRAYVDGICQDMAGRIPAASAVGYQGGHLVSVFIAGPQKPAHVENPLQMPAWQYPTEYGPQSPSFSRGTSVPWAGGRAARFISGTASIRGHQTLGCGDVAQQCSITLENLAQVASEMGEPSLRQLAAGAGDWAAKIYLRQPGDLPAAQAALAENGHAWLLEKATILHSDICRASLAVEIELSAV